MQNRTADFLFLAAAFLLAFFCLFLGRTADDNSLFSWSWVFARTSALTIYLLLVSGLILSFFLSKSPTARMYPATFLASLSFAVCLPVWREPEIIVDAARYFTQAKHLEVYGIGYFLKEWGRTIQAWTDLPLVPFLYGLIFKLFGESRIAIQVFTTALFSCTVVLTYFIGKRLWNEDTGFSAGIFLLGIPYLLTQVPLMLVDVPTMFFVTLAVFAFLGALHRRGFATAFFAIGAIVLAMLTKYSAWFMLSVLGVAFIVYSLRGTGLRDLRPARRGVIILLTAAALSGVALLLKFEVISGQIALLLAYQKPGLGRWGESFLSTFLFQTHPFVTLSALVSLAFAVRRRDANYAIISWPLLLIVLFGIRRIRYTLPLFPMLSLMAGYGLQSVVTREDLKRFILFGTVASTLVMVVFAYLPFAENMSAANLKHAGEYLNTLDTPAIEVIAFAPGDPVANPAVAVPLLDLFTDKQIRFRYHPEEAYSQGDVARSSLRFTWEYRNPAYYSSNPLPGRAPVVVISDASHMPLPDPVVQRLGDRRLSKSFIANENIFQYTVGVRIYQKTLPDRPSIGITQ